MDARSGRIYEALSEEDLAAFKSMHDRPLIPLTEDQAKKLMPLSKRKRKNNMRNQPCMCGSGKKFKRCCWSQYA